MIELVYVVGAGIISLLLIYFAFKLQQDHFILQLISIVFALITMMIIPWAFVGAQMECDNVMTSKYVVGANETYTYEKQCIEKESNLPSTTLKVYMTFFTLFAIYLSVMLIKYVIDRSQLKEGKQ